MSFLPPSLSIDAPLAVVSEHLIYALFIAFQRTVLKAPSNFTVRKGTTHSVFKLKILFNVTKSLFQFHQWVFVVCPDYYGCGRLLVKGRRRRSRTFMSSLKKRSKIWLYLWESPDKDCKPLKGHLSFSYISTPLKGCPRFLCIVYFRIFDLPGSATVQLKEYNKSF